MNDSYSSRLSYTKRQRSSTLSAPEVSISNKWNSANSLLLEVNSTETDPWNGLYIYCDKCDMKKIEISTTASGLLPVIPNSGDYIEEAGRGSDGTYSIVAYLLKGLSADTTYTFQVAKYIEHNMKKYESPKTDPITITTIATDL
jgi:hypothetical protein